MQAGVCFELCTTRYVWPSTSALYGTLKKALVALPHCCPRLAVPLQGFIKPRGPSTGSGWEEAAAPVAFINLWQESLRGSGSCRPPSHVSAPPQGGCADSSLHCPERPPPKIAFFFLKREMGGTSPWRGARDLLSPATAWDCLHLQQLWAESKLR